MGPLSLSSFGQRELVVGGFGIMVFIQSWARAAYTPLSLGMDPGLAWGFFHQEEKHRFGVSG